MIDFDALEEAVRLRDPVFVTFKVTREGEVGHPMDHVLTTVAVGPGGEPDEEAIALVIDRLRREIRRVAS